jgi:hypothetical protein
MLAMRQFELNGRLGDPEVLDSLEVLNHHGLHQLDLSSNTIQGSLPARFGCLGNLTHINLNLNSKSNSGDSYQACRQGMSAAGFNTLTPMAAQMAAPCFDNCLVAAFQPHGQQPAVLLVLMLMLLLLLLLLMLMLLMLMLLMLLCRVDRHITA